jgi:hypothetical protein
MKTKIVNCRTADSKPVKQEVNGTVILPPLVFPAPTFTPSLGTPAPDDYQGFLKFNLNLKNNFKLPLLLLIELVAKYYG